MLYNKYTREEPEAQYGSRTAGDILQEFLEKFDARLARNFRERLCRELFPDTHLCVDVKTYLRDRTARVGKAYRGVLVRDAEEHFSFFQNALEKERKVTPRNPIVHAGRRINVHRAANGSLYPTFNRPRLTDAFTFSDFCQEAAEELLYVARLASRRN